MRCRHSKAFRLVVLSLGVACVAAGQPRMEFHLAGSAEIAGGRLRLTRPELQTSGAAWFSEKAYLAGGFDAVFLFEITEPGGLGPGADGFAFVLQNEGLNALAGRGSAGGFALGDGWRDFSKPGTPRSIAVFFDTYRNHDANDPSDNYVAICTNGPIPKMRWPPNRLVVSRRLSIRLKDGRQHTARIRYRPPWLSVSLDDGEPVARAPVDISAVVDAEGRAYVGFTASTGHGYENHDILAWSFKTERPEISSSMFTVQSELSYQMSDCLEDRNLCTPAAAEVSEIAKGEYRIVAPAHLEWGASIPNPEGRTVTVEEVRGVVCWDLKAADGSGCGGRKAWPGMKGRGTNCLCRIGILGRW